MTSAQVNPPRSSQTSALLLPFLQVAGRAACWILSAFIVDRTITLLYDPHQVTLQTIAFAERLPLHPVDLVIFKNASGVPQVEYHHEVVPLLSCVHYLCAIVFMCAGPLQFVQRLRSAYPLIHRLTGYLFLLSSLVLICSGIGFTYPFTNSSYAGFSWDLFVFILAFIQLLTGIMALLAARRKNFRTHREWMIRHLATGYSIPLIRFFALALAPIAKLTMVSPSPASQADFTSLSFMGFFFGFGLVSLRKKIRSPRRW